MSEKYTKAELYDAGGDITKDWYIQNHFRSPVTGEMERFKPTFNINRKHTLSERYNWGREAVKFMNERLEDGYDPFLEQELMKRINKKKMLVVQAVLIWFPKSLIICVRIALKMQVKPIV